MTPAELRTARERLGLSRAGLAQRLEVKTRTVKAWEVGERNVPAWHARMLQILLSSQPQEEASPTSG